MLRDRGGSGQLPAVWMREVRARLVLALRPVALYRRVEGQQWVAARPWRGRASQTALHKAVGRGHTGITLTLLDKGAQLEAVDLNGRTPPLLAAAMGHAEPVSSCADAVLAALGAASTASATDA